MSGEKYEAYADFYLVPGDESVGKFVREHFRLNFRDTLLRDYQ